MDAQALRESVTDAIRYWEPRRLAYNAALAIIVVVYFFLLYPHSKSALTLDGFLGVFLLAVLPTLPTAPRMSLMFSRSFQVTAISGGRTGGYCSSLALRSPAF